MLQASVAYALPKQKLCVVALPRGVLTLMQTSADSLNRVRNSENHSPKHLQGLPLTMYMHIDVAVGCVAWRYRDHDTCHHMHPTTRHHCTLKCPSKLLQAKTGRGLAECCCSSAVL